MSARRTISATVCSGTRNGAGPFYVSIERYILHSIRDEIDRRRVEEDLIKGLLPRMNDAEIGSADPAKAAKRAQQLKRWFDMRGWFGSPGKTARA